MSLGFGIPVTGRTVSLASEDELRKALLDAQGISGVQIDYIRDELSKRLIQRQIDATSEVTQAVKALTASSTNLEGLTRGLVGETTEIRTGIVGLNRYSGKLEHLTHRLIALTWALIGLTALAVIVPVGVEVWHAYRELTAPVPPLEYPTPPLMLQTAPPANKPPAHP